MAAMALVMIFIGAPWILGAVIDERARRRPLIAIIAALALGVAIGFTLSKSA